MKTQIIAIVNRLQRFREATLESHFTLEQREVIMSWPSDESFKIKMLRTAGLGLCKHCGNDCQHVRKTSFHAFCSSSCELAHRREKRLEEFNAELLSYGLHYVSGDFQSLNSELTFSCVASHTFTKRLKDVRRTKKCPVCCEESVAACVVPPAPAPAPEPCAVVPRVARRTKIKNEHLIGRDSIKKCKYCGTVTKYEVRGSEGKRYAYAPVYCNEECAAGFKHRLKTEHLERAKARLDQEQFAYVAPTTEESLLTDKHLIHFKKCDHTYPVILRNVANSPVHYQNGCPECGKFVSSPAQKLIDALSRHVNLQINNRRILAGQEIDIFVPSHSLGIEVDGLWWHSSLYKPKDYHAKKTTAAALAGVRLLHFFTDEIAEKFDIIESMLLQRLGASSKIYARKCAVSWISNEEASAFLDSNHLQGSSTSKYRIGLHFGDELVSVMTVRKPYMHRNVDWEIARMATKLGVTVIGGASKMMKFFRDSCAGSILTYSDNRYATGAVYEKLGFELAYETAPGFSYVVGQRRESRFKYQKGKLAALGFDVSSGTEESILLDAGIPRIYDCGNKVWIMK